MPLPFPPHANARGIAAIGRFLRRKHFAFWGDGLRMDLSILLWISEEKIKPESCGGEAGLLA